MSVCSKIFEIIDVFQHYNFIKIMKIWYFLLNEFIENAISPRLEFISICFSVCFTFIMLCCWAVVLWNFPPNNCMSFENSCPNPYNTNKEHVWASLFWFSLILFVQLFYLLRNSLWWFKEQQIGCCCKFCLSQQRCGCYTRTK